MLTSEQKKSWSGKMAQLSTDVVMGRVSQDGIMDAIEERLTPEERTFAVKVMIAGAIQELANELPKNDMAFS